MVQALRDIKAQNLNELPADFQLPTTDKTWHDLLKGEDRKRALGALQACTALAIHKGLRGGRLWVAHSWKHRNREDFLIPKDQWERDRNKLTSAMNAFSDPRLYLKRTDRKSVV